VLVNPLHTYQFLKHLFNDNEDWLNDKVFAIHNWKRCLLFYQVS
jgi:hypothetical protein